MSRPVVRLPNAPVDELLAMDWSTFTSPEWSSADMHHLIRLWMAGDPLSAVARAMKRTKFCIARKAHRMGLPRKASPIKRSGATKRARPLRPGECTLPSLSGERAPHLLDHETDARLGPVRKDRFDPDRMCCWLIEQPGQPRFLQCDEPALASKSYCSEHFALAYVPRGNQAVGASSSSEAVPG